LYSYPLGPSQLQKLAARLGSDVSFFFHGSAALMSGRGERIENLSPRGDFVLVLVYPGFPIPTAEAYGWFDETDKRNLPSLAPEDLKEQFEEKNPDSWAFFNSFQPLIESRYPAIAGIVADMVKSGAHLVNLSGSGSSVFGVFTDRKAARSVYRRLRRSHPDVWLLIPLQSGGLAD
jgi:4-diphosphocytidyl-2-C-methyl-D-erythritol kinase